MRPARPPGLSSERVPVFGHSRRTQPAGSARLGMRTPVSWAPAVTSPWGRVAADLTLNIGGRDVGAQHQHESSTWYEGGQRRVKNPGLGRLGAQAGLKAYTPIVKRRARKRVGGVGDTVRTVGDSARPTGRCSSPTVLKRPGLGLVSAPKPKRTVPRVAAGVVIGAGAAYFLEPEHGAQRREKALSLVG